MTTAETLKQVFEMYCLPELIDREPERGDSWHRQSPRVHSCEIEQRLSRIQFAILDRKEMPTFSDLAALVNEGLMLLALAAEQETTSEHGLGDMDLPDRFTASEGK